MNLIVDSSVWIDSFNPKIKSIEKEVLKQLIINNYPIYLCPVIYQEILQGIKDDKVLKEIKYILQQYKMLEIDLMDVTNHAINLYRNLRKKRITIRKPVNCLIATYAILENMYILHNDSDFTQIAKGSKLQIYKI
jgi:predicted nucleic acid-binding protein